MISGGRFGVADGDHAPRAGAAEPNPDAERIRQWMRQVMREKALTSAAWARMAKINRSTINRAINPDYQYITSTVTLSKLARAANVAPPSLDPPQLGREVATQLPIRHEVGAGWRAVDDVGQRAYGFAPVLADPAYSGFPQWLERVVGDSMDLEYPPGTLLHVVDTIELGYAARAGDHVIVQRTRDGGDAERSVKEFAFGPGGVKKLISRSSNPRWANHPIVLNPDGRDLEHFQVEIVGLVLGSYRSRRG